MAKSRLIYFKKQIESFPDDPAFGVYWRRNIIGPRFMRLVCNEFVKATQSRESLALATSLAHMQEIAPIMNSRTRRRMKILAPIMGVLYRWRFYGLARSLARRAVHY
jgi:hypothetical protein